ncbi:MAG TPA: DUF2567 domain-containing protein [Micromonosporaceae bacterium]|jgi:hypothetical protein
MPVIGRRLVVAGAIVLAVGSAGAPFGLLWAAVAPDVPVSITDSGPMLGDPAPEQFVAADGWFTLLGLGVGALAAAAAWALARRTRGPVGLVAVALGAAVAGLIAWQIGRHVGLAEYHRLLDHAAAGQTLGKPGDLRGAEVRWWPPALRGDVLVPAFAAAGAYTLLAGWSRHPSLRPPRPVDTPEPPQISWGSPAPPRPTAAPAPPAPGAAAPPPD